MDWKLWLSATTQPVRQVLAKDFAEARRAYPLTPDIVPLKEAEPCKWTDRTGPTGAKPDRHR